MEEEAMLWYEILGIVLSIFIVVMFASVLFLHFFAGILNRSFGFVEILYIKLTGRPLMKHFVLFKKKLEQGEETILYNTFRMYRKLPPDEQEVFQHRVARFMSKKEFDGRSGIDLDRRKKIIISGIAVKLTFGFRRYSMPIVQKIIVFPEPFKNSRTGNFHKGEFSVAQKHIAFSWKDLIQGIEDPNDNLHLGLHEFAHALLLELLHGHWADSYFKHRFQEVDRLMKKPENFRRISSHPYFREYAQTNKMEFFAVAVEHFFETPLTFRRQLPDLYDIFMRMFNLDPVTFN
ncbi:MAG: zinc-dependent peptidase [Cryomorphaceae bacterium]|nr:zinc-dependent peptidase [Cryomorphaceae bacterium]